MIQAICWMLIHSFWQGLLFSIVAGLGMTALRKKAAALRYHFLGALVFLFLAGCVCTFFREWQLQVEQAGAGLSGDGMAAGIGIARLAVMIRDYFSGHASLIVSGWFIIFLFKCIRMAASLSYAQRIRREGTAPAPVEWVATLAVFCRQMGIRKKVRLVQSRLVKMPVVAGCLKPVILVPLGLLTQLPPGEIEAMLLHELAHVRRNDYLMNVIQHLVENLFFFNPGILWISSLLRQEREYCCDDMALSRTNNKIEFVKALINFKEYDLRAGVVAPAFPAKGNQLLRRVSRIVHNNGKVLDHGEKIFLLGSALVIGFLMAASTSSMGFTAGDHRQVFRGKDRMVSRTDRDLPAGEIKEWLMGTSLQDQAPAPEVVAQTAKIQRSRIHFGQVKAPAGKRGEMQTIAQTDAQGREQMERDMKLETRDNLDNEKRTEVEGNSDRQQAARDKAQAERDAQQVIRDRDQAERDKQQAVKDSEQAARDRDQAERDKHQAELDRIQAGKDQAQAVKDREQADKDRAQAGKDHMPADKGRKG